MDNNLQEQVNELQKKVDDLYDGNDISDLFQDMLQRSGFIQKSDTDIITYTNPSGKDYFSSFVRSNDRNYTLAFESDGYYVKVDRVDDTADTLIMTNHDFSNGNQVVLATTNTLPGGLSIQTIYYIVNSTSNSVQLSLSLGGAAINLTSNGNGIHYLYYVT